MAIKYNNLLTASEILKINLPELFHLQKDKTPDQSRVSPVIPPLLSQIP